MLSFRDTTGGSNSRRRIKDRFQLAQAWCAHYFRFRDPHLAAHCYFQHPERHLENTKDFAILRTALSYSRAPLHERAMHPPSAAVPRMPRIAHFSMPRDMGVVLMSCLVKTAFTISLKRIRRIGVRSNETFGNRDGDFQSVVWRPSSSVLLARSGISRRCNPGLRFTRCLHAPPSIKVRTDARDSLRAGHDPRRVMRH